MWRPQMRHCRQCKTKALVPRAAGNAGGQARKPELQRPSLPSRAPKWYAFPALHDQRRCASSPTFDSIRYVGLTEGAGSLIAEPISANFCSMQRSIH